MTGRAVAQAVICRLPTVAARVRARVSWDLWWTKWYVFSEFSRFPYQSFHRLLHIHHPLSGAGTVGELVADVQSGLSVTLPQECLHNRHISTPQSLPAVLLAQR
jgi:hypothetical protein